MTYNKYFKVSISALNENEFSGHYQIKILHLHIFSFFFFFNNYPQFQYNLKNIKFKNQILIVITNQTKNVSYSIYGIQINKRNERKKKNEKICYLRKVVESDLLLEPLTRE